MAKIIKTILLTIDYYINSNRIVSVFIQVIKKLHQQEGWLYEYGEDCCILFKSQTEACFLIKWSNYMSESASLVVHCGFFPVDGRTPQSLWSGQFHQMDEEFANQSWVWLPRINTDGPTSYKVKYLHSQKGFRWKKSRVGRGTDAPFCNTKTMNELVNDLFDTFKEDFDRYSHELERLIKAGCNKS